MRTRLSKCTLLVFVAAAVAVAQQAVRPLTHRDYAAWRSIQSPQLARDGKRLAYALFPQEGDGEIVVRDLVTGKELREGAGELPPPPDPSPDSEEQGPPPPAVRLLFTNSGRFVAATAFPTKTETEKAKKEKKKPEEMPKRGLLIIDTATGASTRIADVKSFQAPEKGGEWIAYLKEGKPAAKPAPRELRKEYGSELVLRDLSKPEPNERSFQDVLEYSLSKDGRTLVYAVSSKQEETNGIYAVGTANGVASKALLAGKGRYSKLTWNRPQSRLAFLSDRDDAAAKQPKFKLYLWERGAAAASETISPATEGFRDGWTISDRGSLSFSRDGSRLFLGCAPVRAAEDKEPDAAPATDKVIADLWRWNDDYIQPMQKVRAARERTRSYTGVFHIASKEFVQLGGPELQTILPSDDGSYAVGVDDRPYRRMVDYDGSYADYYQVCTTTGQRTRYVEKLRGSERASGNLWSPDGRHLLFFRDRHWHAVTVPGGTVTNLTAPLGVNFYNEDDDRPEPVGSHGTAGWTADGKYVLLYDRFDIWQVSPDGKSAKNITNAYGRRENIQFRVVRLDRDDDDEPRGIDPAKPLLLRAESLANRDTGFWRTQLNASQAPRKLMMGPRNYRALSKAKDADVILLTASTFRDFPDLQTTDSTFGELRKVSNANPQQAQFTWGTGEFIRYETIDGIKLDAALYKPDNFDPSKKYPMLVYIYERLSQNLHSFVDPKPGTSINIAHYVSNGYLVLTPDIVYTVGAPGQSALKCVLPAVQAVVNRGFVNEDAIGIQGHSWGGYQTAYLLTQTNRFRAAEAGAPVGNMISAYNGIRWGSGLPRQFQYEQTQSRIGGSLWECPLRFVENSPIFMADRVRTPLLILHDDQDDAVPWYQGIELFLSLRRLGKEAYLFNYNGELHGLRKRHNQKDYTMRMQQFFDHFLKGAPKPEWMEKGIPYIERETEKAAFAGN
jgi:dipeptidyl aminopeptidase/acylaminoacyl peptidase